MAAKTSKTAGFSLLELALAVGLFMIFAVGLAATAIGGHLSSLDNATEARANMVLVESWEALKSIKTNSWSRMTSGTHGLAIGGSHWEFSGNSDSADGFDRVITISDVRRDNAGIIVSSGGEIDPDTKLVSLNLSWTTVTDQPRSLELESYMTNHASPIEWPIPEPDPEP